MRRYRLPMLLVILSILIVWGTLTDRDGLFGPLVGFGVVGIIAAFGFFSDRAKEKRNVLTQRATHSP